MNASLRQTRGVRFAGIAFLFLVIGCNPPAPEAALEPTIADPPEKPRRVRICECDLPISWESLSTIDVVQWAAQRSMYETMVSHPTAMTKYDPKRDRTPPQRDDTWKDATSLGDRPETAFWVYQYQDTSDKALAECGGKPSYFFDVSPILSSGLSGEVDMQEDVWGVPPSTEMDNSTPIGAEGRTIAAFHVHPGGASNPSASDTQNASERGIPHFILHPKGHESYGQIYDTPDFGASRYQLWDDQGSIGGREKWSCPADCSSGASLTAQQVCPVCAWSMTFSGNDYSSSIEGDAVHVQRAFPPAPATIVFSGANTSDFIGAAIQTPDALPYAPATLKLGASREVSGVEDFDGYIQVGIVDASFASGDGAPCCAPNPTESLPPPSEFALTVNTPEQVAGRVTGTLWNVDTGNPIETGLVDLEFVAIHGGACTISDPANR